VRADAHRIRRRHEVIVVSADPARGARTDDSRRPQSTAPWQTNAPGDAQVQGRTPTTTSDHIRRRPRVTAS
jgi:hypothetical protein